MLIPMKCLVESVQLVREQLTATVSAAVKDLSAARVPFVDARVSAVAAVKPTKLPVSEVERRSNIILFGLPENKSLADTKSAVDDIFVFLTGRSIPLNDAFRLGRRKEKPELSSDSVPPCPLLVKLCNVWDKRLVLASKSKLRGYTVPKVFLREDLPLEVRKARALQWERRKALLPRSNSNSSLSSTSSHADSHVDSSSPALGAQEDYHRDV